MVCFFSYNVHNDGYQISYYDHVILDCNKLVITIHNLNIVLISNSDCVKTKQFLFMTI